MRKNSVFAVICFIFFIPVLIGILFFWPSLVWAESQIFISQVQITGGTGKTAEDFIELFNPSDSQANLNDYRLVKRTENGTSDTLIKSWITDTYIPARSFYLWANSGFSSISKVPNATTSVTISDNNGIALRVGPNDTGVIIDSISWGSASNGFVNVSAANPEANMALQRQDLYQTGSAFSVSASNPRNASVSDALPNVSTTTPETTSTTTPDSAGNLQSATSTPGSASSTPESLTQSFKVKIFRFLPNPLGDDAGKEWVEIKNGDEKEVLLDGWPLDDKNTGEGPAGDALALSGVIIPGETKRFFLPPGAFALNNSGGDEINLYFGDKSLADRVVYTQTAYDDGIFEFREGAWQQPARASSGSGGGGGSAAAPDLTNLPSAPALRFNEILPNPLGDDAGKEWVEILNPNTATTTLEGYFLANGDSDSWSALAWAIPKGELIPPLGLTVISLPKDAFTLKNTGKEKVKLFSPQKQLLDFVVYENAPENKTWAKNQTDKWEWSIPTFGAPNDQTPELAKVFISEILPQPAGDDEEFVELFNFATTTVNLEGAVLRIGSRGKTFEASAEIEPGGYLAIYEDDLPVRLRNTGQTVKLFDAFGRLVAETTYGKAQAGLSFASNDGKNYLWTAIDSPGAVNEFVLGEAIAASTKQPESVSKVSSNTAAAAITRAQAKEILETNRQLEAQLQVLQESVNQLANNRDDQDQTSRPGPAVQTEPTNRASNYGVLSLIIGAFVIVAG
ncbi:MAG: lamin tail domain-containing protein, partial [bacterium]|nr:lamin tail domain-containing protein [bacterium]